MSATQPEPVTELGQAVNPGIEAMQRERQAKESATFPTERDFQDAVCEMAKWMGCLVYHTHDSRRSEPGFPDLVIVGRRGFVFRELKAEKGRLRPEQTEWLDKLVMADADADVWRPSDWPDRVRSELQAIA